MKRKTVKPTPGHKCEGVVAMFHVNCECGYSTGHFASRKDAYTEWRSHVEECAGGDRGEERVVRG